MNCRRAVHARCPSQFRVSAAHRFSRKPTRPASSPSCDGCDRSPLRRCEARRANYLSAVETLVNVVLRLVPPEACNDRYDRDSNAGSYQAILNGSRSGLVSQQTSDQRAHFTRSLLIGVPNDCVIARQALRLRKEKRSNVAAWAAKLSILDVSVLGRLRIAYLAKDQIQLW
jgi:hypothetical protein